MKCLVVMMMVAACASAAAAAAASCALSQDFLGRHDPSADESHEPGPICGGQCCGRGREQQLKASLRRTAEGTAVGATRPIAELLVSTRQTLQEHLTSLSHQSQNKTAVLFSQLYRSHATRTHGPLSTLYEDIRMLLQSGPERDLDGQDLGSPPPRDLAASSRKFFREVFPVAYQKGLRLESRFTREYEDCLQDAYDAVQPFGDVPQQLGKSLSRSLEAARTLLQVLAVGAGALAASERVLLSSHEDCANKLLKMAGCGHCRGHAARPCRSYCLNVARGCIGSLVAELDAPWAGYVEGVERLARPEADSVLRNIDAVVSKAIMVALENHSVLEKKLRQECGAPSTLDTPGLSSPLPTPPSRRDALRAPPKDMELLQFAATLAASKKLFSTLADGLCDQPDLIHDDNERCWNGDSVGEYSKSLVASASWSDQRYNPEVPGGASQDTAVAAVGDKLRHAAQLLVSHTWGGAPAAEAFMLGDEAEGEGSGSGRSYPDDYDAEGSGDEGSGMHSGIEGTNRKMNVQETEIHQMTPKGSAVLVSHPAISMLLSATLMLVTTYCFT